MRHLPLLLSFLASTLVTLPAQTVDTLGGTNSPATRTNTSKSSLYQVDSSVYVLEFEVYLDVPGPETLTFFSYQHHSRSGTASLYWTYPVQVQGGTGAGWYSTGPIALPLVGGNFYTLGVSWPGTLTYYYNTASTNWPVSFGSWQRAHTISNPLPATLSISAGVDVAQYHQRITSIALPDVTNVGTGCAAGTIPRLVASGVFAIGATQLVQLVDATPSSLGVISIGLGPTLPTPIPMFGCSIWVNPMFSFPLAVSTAGYASLPLTVPNDSAFTGVQFSTQGGVVGATIDISNAIDVTIQ